MPARAEADDGTWALDNWRVRDVEGLVELFRHYRPLRIGGPGGQWTMWQAA